MIDGAVGRSLKSGALTFSAYEMGEGPLALCIHGFPDTPHTFREMLPALASAGYRAVAVTSRGYEQSSQPPDHDYSVAALAGDVRGWLDALGAEKAHLIGHDWGANLAYAASALCPDRIDKLVMMSVPQPAAFAASMMADYDQTRRSWYIFWFQLPGVAEALLPANQFAFLKRLWRDWSPSWDDAGALSAMQEAFSQPGVLSAALEYYRTAFNAAHPRAIASQGLLSTPIVAPTLGVCGGDDGCISADVFEAAMPPALFSGGVRTVRVARAGHFAHLERPDAVHEAVLGHLRG
ncbi:MAG: alpha/beta hydrolase [Hyphomonadaceae bacterium JAD_PAG50586_4]|nr:MAG: alpha/beta hydrolase [Hyphomonadaceae bacterium JAD_PAG50586_4]